MIRVVIAIVLKAVGVGVLLLLARTVVWIGKTLVWAPLFDPFKKLVGPEGSMFQSHLRDVLE
jgi:hypothetical protein